MLGAQNSPQTDEFFTRVMHETLDVYYLNQICFGLPRQGIRNSDKILLFNRKLADVESVKKEIGGHEMAYCEFKHIRRRTWADDSNYRFIDGFKKNVKKIVFVMKVKTFTFKVRLKKFMLAFSNSLNVLFKKTDMIWKS